MAAKSAPSGDVQKQIDEEQDQGYLGTKVDPEPNSAYTQESGPGSPSVATDDAGRVVQHAIKES